MEYFNKVKEIIMRYEFAEKNILDDGTVLIGKAPHVAPQAWLHNLYPVLKEIEISEIEDKISIPIPNEYKSFLLTYSNGLSFFVDTLSLYGLRKKLGRSIESAWQPYSIFTPNSTIERISNAKSHQFFIGGYNWDGSKLYIDNNTGKVHRCSRRSVKSLNIWNSFEEMLLLETERIALLFDKYGVEIDEGKPTTP